jgi:peptidoglycan/LPS O-acetylase OafA/YrhL
MSASLHLNRYALIRWKFLSVSAVSSSDRSYRPDIDGIRAIAILSVLCYHCGVPRITGGFTGVDIFFAISGYLIGGHIFSELRAGKFSFLRFYQRRAKRILPAFYFVLLFTVVISLFLLSPTEASDFGRSAFAAALSGSNLIFWHFSGYFAAKSALNPLLMTWSLGVEEQFYAVIPLIMVLLARIRRSLVLPAILTVCAMSFLLAVFELDSRPALVFYMLPTRAWELGVGVALAVVELNRKRTTISSPTGQLLSLAGVGLMFAPMFLLDARSPFPGLAALPSIIGTALIIAVPGSWVNRRMLSLPPLVFIGKISYSLYLWHWPILAYLHIASGGSVPTPATVLAIGASFAAAVISYYFVEQPFRRSTRAPGPLLLRYGVVSLIILAVSATVWLTNGFPNRFPMLAQLDRTASSALRNDSCLATHDKLSLSPPCYSTSDARPLVAVWGDSHSAALTPGLRSIADSQGYGLVQFGHINCLPLIGAANYQPKFPPGAKQCMHFNREVLELLQSDRRIKVVILAGEWTDSFEQGAMDSWLIADPESGHEPLSQDAASAVFRRSLTASIQGLQTTGKQVIVMEDVPTFSFDPVLKVRTIQIYARHELALWMGAEGISDPGFAPINKADSIAVANAQLKMALEGVQGVDLIDLRPGLCRINNECAYRDGDRILYSDPDHLTADGAQYALRNFRLPSLTAPGV